MGWRNSIANFFGYVRYSDGSHYYQILQNNTSYIDGKDKLQLAIDHSTLASVIAIRADYLSKARFYVEDDNGEKDFNHPSLEWLKNPNPHQSKEDLLVQFEWFMCTYGWTYQKPYKYSSLQDNNVKYMYNLNPSKIQFPKKLGDALIVTKTDEKQYYSKEFAYRDVENTKSIKFLDIIPYFDVLNGINNSDTSSVTSPSRVDSIIKEASNVSLASDAENVVIQTNGREIIYSKGAGSNTGMKLPLQDKDRKVIEEILNKPLTSKRTITPSKELGWVNMTVKLGDLGLNESRETNSNIIAQRFQVPNEIYKAFTKGDTFENQKQAEINFVQNVSQPRADDLASSWTASFGDPNRPFKASFEHLPSMQYIEELKAEKALKLTVAIRNLTQSGLTEQEAELFINNLGIKLES